MLFGFKKVKSQEILWRILVTQKSVLLSTITAFRKDLDGYACL